jgi:hypothetical protein
LLQQPDLSPHLERAWTAFWDLNGDRQLGFGSAGAIMWASIDAYARRYRITGSAFDQMQFLIRSMDNEYQRLSAERAKAATSQS